MIGYTSLHNHTVFCDGKDDVEAMCRSAFEKGLAAIGFSAHAPIGKTGLKTDWHLPGARLEECFDEVRSARFRWEGKIAVYLGLELDYIRGMRSARDEDIAELARSGALDYIIGSAHYIVPSNGPPFNVFTVDGPLDYMEACMRENLGGDGTAMMHAYWDAVIEMVSLGGFDIVAHLDLVRKHNDKMRWFDMESAEYLNRADEAARAIAAAGLVAEVNTGGMNRGFLRETLPSLSILRLLRQRGVPVMISADAHCAADVAGHYEKAREILRDAGYSSHVTFEGKCAGKPVWRERPV